VRANNLEFTFRELPNLLMFYLSDISLIIIRLSKGVVFLSSLFLSYAQVIIAGVVHTLVPLKTILRIRPSVNLVPSIFQTQDRVLKVGLIATWYIFR
jgi:hypothetical protein